MYPTDSKKERVFLTGIIPPGVLREEVEESVDELALLAESAGAEVCGRFYQSLKGYDPAYFIGKGKAAQIAEKIQGSGVDTIIFDDDLTPAQVKNLGTIINKKIIDRTGLILEIFAQNARTKEAKTQVELAQLQYILPRLTRQWKHLERQIGGIGVRAGMGETQLEVDRRLIRTRIKKLKEDLKSIDNQRAVSRKRRGHLFKATLIGYTNAGKSTLFNALTPLSGTEILVADRLFATLDSTVRRLQLEDHQVMLLADTVGFIRKLPHSLIASFRSTFGVVQDADLLLNVIDVSHPNYEEHIKAVKNVLKEMNLDTKPVINIFNKIDLVKDGTVIQDAKQRYPDAVFVSALRGIGLRNVISVVSAAASARFSVKEFTLPIHDSKNIARLFNYGEVLDQTYNGGYTSLKVRLSLENAAKLTDIIKK